MTNLEALLADFYACKHMLDEAKRLVDDAQKRLVSEMDTAGETTIAFENEDGHTISGTLVKATRVVMDDEALQEMLTDEQWDKITTPVLDKSRLEAAVAMQIVSADTVAAASEVRENKPFIKMTVS